MLQKNREDDISLEHIWDTMVLELTTYCDLNCPFCYNDSTKYCRDFLSMENFKIMIDKTKDAHTSVILSGGEPLAHPHIMEMLEYLIKNDVKFHIMTNGLRVTKEIIDILVKYQKASIQISLDGATEEVDDSIRCSGHFNKIVSLMETLNQKGFKRGIVRMVINSINYHQIEDYFYLAKRYNFIPSYLFMIKTGRAYDNWRELFIDDVLKGKLRDDIRQLVTDNIDYFNIFDSKTLMRDLCNKGIHYTEECQFYKTNYKIVPLIHFDGSVQPCQRLYQKEFCIGNLLEQSPNDIVSNGNGLLSQLMEKIMARKVNLNQRLCKKCILNNMCAKGCIADSYDNGDFYGYPISCSMRRNDFLCSVLKGR